MYKCFSCDDTFAHPVSGRAPSGDVPFEEDTWPRCPCCGSTDIAVIHICSVCCEYFPEENDGIFIPERNEYICENCYRKV